MGDSKSAAGAQRTELNQAERSSFAVRPRILLAEDDPVSSAFLVEALRGMGCEVEAVANGELAREVANERRFDALVFDHHLPGMDGDQALAMLRADARAASQNAIAIATTAEPDPAVHVRLRLSGFAQVLLKPLDSGRLREAFHELGVECQRASLDPAVALDDAAGLRASGSIHALTALRGLFARELGTLADEWRDLTMDSSALAERLHRLRAACGFCGALALQSAAMKLSDALGDGNPARNEQARADFQRVLLETREALECPSPQLSPREGEGDSREALGG